MAAMTTSEAVALVNAILIDMDPGPEKVEAADPETVIPVWDAAIDPARADKMQAIWIKVRSRVRHDYDVMHRMPQVFLIAEDGITMPLLGDSSTCGSGIRTTPATT